MDINAFHVYYSSKKEERSFKSYFILTAILSALQWKKNHNGSLKFYTDKYTADFFYKNHLESFWNKIDDKTLDRKIDNKLYDTKTFYAIGKFIAFLNEQTPCAMIDIDLVVWKNIEDILNNKKSVFTHYEKTTPFSFWYPDSKYIQKPNGYNFSNNWNFTDYAANTSFVYFNDEHLKKYYIEQGLLFMKNNFINKNQNNIGNPEILFVEQRLLPFCYKDLGMIDKCSPLLDVVWDAYNGDFIKNKNEWDFFNFDNNSIITHTWIAKDKIDNNTLYQNYMNVRLIEKILEFDNNYYDILSRIKEVKPYIELLDQYKDSKQLVKKRKATDILYIK